MSAPPVRLWPARLRTRWLGQASLEEGTVPSTNDRAWQWAGEPAGAPHGAAVVARRQTAGRGRQGRAWESPPGNLYVSVLLRPESDPAGLLGWPLVVGLSLAVSLEGDLRAPRVGLKWPNDLWLEGRKLGGVLVESRPLPRALVVGVGLNLVDPPGGWGPLRDRAVSLASVGIAADPARVLDRWLPRLEEDWEAFVAEGFAAFRAGWTSRSVLDGRRVTIRPSGEQVDVEGVDEFGALRVRGADGRQRQLYSGEVHLGRPW